jgi:hypothetical protein
MIYSVIFDGEFFRGMGASINFLSVFIAYLDKDRCLFNLAKIVNLLSIVPGST